MPEQRSESSYINIKKVIDRSDICDYDVSELADFIIAEEKVMALNDQYKEYCLNRIRILMRELVSRFRTATFEVNGEVKRYAILREEMKEFNGGVIDCMNVYEVSDFISTKEFTIRNVSNTVGIWNGSEMLLHDEDEDDWMNKSFDIKIGREGNISIKYLIDFNIIDESFINLALSNYCFEL